MHGRVAEELAEKIGHFVASTGADLQSPRIAGLSQGRFEEFVVGRRASGGRAANV